MRDYPRPWPSEAARERAHILAILACVRENLTRPAGDALRSLASVHLEHGRADMAVERSREAHNAPCGRSEAPQCVPGVEVGGEGDPSGPNSGLESIVAPRRNGMTCSCGRFELIERPPKVAVAAWGDRYRFPRYIRSGKCPDCGDTLNADGTVDKPKVALDKSKQGA